MVVLTCGESCLFHCVFEVGLVHSELNLLIAFSDLLNAPLKFRNERNFIYYQKSIFPLLDLEFAVDARQGNLAIEINSISYLFSSFHRIIK